MRSQCGAAGFGSGCILRDNHELLEGKTTTGVRATIEHVHEGNGEDVGLLGTSEIRDVCIKRDALLGSTGFGNS
jgi:hypothetical protein